MMNLVRPGGLAIIFSALFACSCSSRQFERLDASLSAADRVDAGDSTGDSAPQETVEVLSLLPTGAPCTQTEEERCYAGFCMTTDFVAAMAPGAEIPGGMCSKLGCHEDQECGPAGFCLQPGDVPSIPLSLCLKKCNDYYDCRYGEGYICFGAQELGETRVCLPISVIRMLECGDGVCDDFERWNPDVCPEDCP